ncbi:hypothetical protein [Desulfovibrio sp. SGI.169]|uniref:hypothetical protein n=1 Tax=Desulfovibrio sp. SGI.169 TaxID=3420561 RepID=UPI003D04BE18
MSPRKTLTINVTEEEHRQAKIIAAMAGKTMKEIFLEAIARLKKEQEKENGSK